MNKTDDLMSYHYDKAKYIAWADWPGLVSEYLEYRKAWPDVPAKHESIVSATQRVPSARGRGGTP